ANSIEECERLIRAGVEARNRKEHVKSLELLTDAKLIAETNNFPRQLFLAYNNIGLNHYVRLDYGEALNNYLEAYKIALKDLDSSSEMTVLNNIAILYSKENRMDKAEEYFDKAFSLAKKNKDSLKTGFYAVNLAIVAKERGQLKQADEYINMALPLLDSQPEVLQQGKLVEAKILFKNNSIDRAEQIANNLLHRTDGTMDSDHKVAVLLLLSDIYDRKQNRDKAIEYALSTLDGNHIDIESKISIFKHLSELYRKYNDPNNALCYRDSLDMAKDSLNVIKNEMLFENSRIKFELQNYREELMRSKGKLDAQQTLNIVMFSFFAFVIILIFWVFRASATRHKQRKIIAEHTQKITGLELEKEQNNRLLLEKQLKEKETLILLEKEKLRNEIESKNRQLAVKALHLANKNELIDSILHSLSVIPAVANDSAITRQITKLKHNLKEDNMEWQNFLTHFEDVNQRFLSALKTRHPGLSANDIRFLSYVYINLNSKEISSMLNITHDACRKRKERICIKMNLPENADLYHYLSTI
ncbi:MAG: tetratricopeptide repeat protein, partial [Prevotellaceae bacterium]|nr:tetratricopeptide repeat protein [Prevotellaceae bacterium]